MLRPKNVFAPSEDNLRLLHKMSLTFSHYRPQRPMCKGLGHVRDISFPSRLPHIFESRLSPYYIIGKI